MHIFCVYIKCSHFNFSSETNLSSRTKNNVPVIVFKYVFFVWISNQRRPSELNIHFDWLKLKKNLIKKHIFNNLVCGKFSEDKNLKIFYFLYFNDHDILDATLQDKFCQLFYATLQDKVCQWLSWYKLIIHLHVVF
jgi:hypothetical protein